MSGLVKHLVPVAAFVLATSATALLFSGSRERPQTQTQRSPASSSSAPSVPIHTSSMDLKFRPLEGRRYTYSFQRSISIQGLPQGNSEISYHGQLELDVTKSHAGGFEALTRAHLAEHPVRDAVTLRIQVSANGEKLAIFGAPLRDEEERQRSAILKDLLAQWDFGLREDTVGAFEAKFESEPLRKTKLAYVSSIAGTSMSLPEIKDSEHYLEWDPQRALPRQVVGRETTQMGKGSLELSSESRYQILLVKDDVLSARVASAASRLSDPETLALTQSSKNGDTASATTLSWSVMASELQELDLMDSQGQLKIFGDLVRFIKGNKGAAADLLGLLSTDNVLRLGTQSALFNAVVGALATAGTPEAQAAVLKIYSDPSCPVSGKGAILAALTTTQTPLTSTTQDFLASAMKTETNSDLSQGASYAFGASIKKSGDETQRADMIDTLRQAWIGSNGKLADQLAVLDAIGNSGQAAYLPELKNIIGSRDQNPALRAKAVFALRFIGGTEATQLLIQSLAESEARVRQAAVHAMASASWNESFRGPLKTCAASDSIPSIQSSCRSVLDAADQLIAAN